MDIANFCNLFYSAHNISIAYFENRELVYTSGYPDFFSPSRHVFQELANQNLPLAIISSSDYGYYGLLHNPDLEEGLFMIGPAFSTSLSEESIRAFMHSTNISLSRIEDTRVYIAALPHFTYYRFVNIMTFLHLSLFNEIIPTEQIYHIENDLSTEPIAQKVSHKYYDDRENNVIHGTYLLEQRLLSMVKEGDVEKLKKFLLETVKNTPLSEGLVGDNPTRQAKNIFLSTVAVVGKYAAIPAGMDIELAYQLIDQYSMECERLQSIEAITSLHYNMFLDFTRRISEIKIPEGLSSEAYRCIQYVNQHVNEPISVLDVANYINKSRSYTLTHFKEELGFTLGEYISHARIQEAKSLLRYTDKSLSEISNYLCYSSQSYFQNVFKKSTGMTPLEYRKRS